MDKKLAKGIAKAGICTALRHLFVCLGPKCCARKEGEALWSHIKERVKESGLPVMRTKADCLRVCEAGPLVVIYPEGIWYARVTPERFDRILKEHLGEGRPIEEWILVRNGVPLPEPEEEDHEDNEDGEEQEGEIKH